MDATSRDPGVAVASVDVDVDPLVGLTAAQVAERIAAGLTNAYAPDSSRSAWNIVRANVFTLFNGIIFACFAVLFALGRWQDALFGLAALSNAIIGCVQEFRAKAALDRLALLNAPHARVRREGDEAEVLPADIVLDDILVLRAGDQVSADAEVVGSRALQIDESMLTGESDAVDKRPGDEALSGSVVVAGEGAARVTRIGADSYANRFASDAKRFSLVTSELRTSVNRVLTWVGWGIGPIGLLVLNAQVMVAGGWRTAWQTGSWVQAVVNTVAALTAMIPLGLVLMTSIAFAVGAARLARRQVLVNELPRWRASRASTSCASTRREPSRWGRSNSTRRIRSPIRRPAGRRRSAGSARRPTPTRRLGACASRIPPTRSARPPLCPSRPHASGARCGSTGSGARGCWARPRWCSGMPPPTPTQSSAASSRDSPRQVAAPSSSGTPARR
ncbi:hypothetical protein FHS08_000506 [Microbacterium ulmi]|nr:hypothetical protein [Microbacterium ulmi]